MRAFILGMLFTWNVSNGFSHSQGHRHCTTSRMNAASLDNTGEQQLQKFEENRRPELKRELKTCGEKTDRGFRASSEEQNKIRRTIFQLAARNPTSAPAEAYFSLAPNKSGPSKSASSTFLLKGKWTLIFTDAPDITSLKNPLNPLADLARIGQECDPPTITNVIEGKAPVWVNNYIIIPDW